MKTIFLAALLALPSLADEICRDSNSAHDGSVSQPFNCSTSPSFTLVDGSRIAFSFAGFANVAGAARITVNGTSGLILCADATVLPAEHMVGSTFTGETPSAHYLLYYSAASSLWFLQGPQGCAVSGTASLNNPGRVLYAQGNGGLASDSGDRFFWSSSTLRLGVNVGNSPASALDVSSATNASYVARFYDQRATTGSTRIAVRAGAGQSTNLQEWQDMTGGPIAMIGADGTAKVQAVGGVGNAPSISSGTMAGFSTPVSGSFTATATGAYSATMTMLGLTARNGWACWFTNLTSGAAIRQNAYSTTTVGITGAVVNGDQILYGCHEM